MNGCFVCRYSKDYWCTRFKRKIRDGTDYLSCPKYQKDMDKIKVIRSRLK